MERLVSLKDVRKTPLEWEMVRCVCFVLFYIDRSQQENVLMINKVLSSAKTMDRGDYWSTFFLLRCWVWSSWEEKSCGGKVFLFTYMLATAKKIIIIMSFLRSLLLLFSTIYLTDYKHTLTKLHITSDTWICVWLTSFYELHLCSIVFLFD